MTRRFTFAIAIAAMAAACSDDSGRVSSPVHHQPAPQPSNTVIDANGNPSPSGADRILVDTRASLQQATTLSQAWALFPGNDHSAARAAAGGTGWGFVTNVDGNGTHALRADWTGESGTCSSETIRIGDHFATPYPAQLYIQWKQYLGRSPNDAAGNGSANSFLVTNSACSGQGRRELRVFSDTGTKTVDVQWVGSPTAKPRFQTSGGRVAGNQGWTFLPEQNTGRPIEITEYVQAESAPGANDGVVRMWIDGKLFIEQTALTMSATAFKLFRFPTSFGGPPQDESEYYWDVVAWSPSSTPPPAPVKSVSVALAANQLSPNQTTTATATLKDSAGNTLSGRSIAWTSSNTSVATVASSGASTATVTAVAAGTANIVATSEGVSGQAALTVNTSTPTAATVTVSPSSLTLTTGGTGSLTVTVRDGSGNVISRPVTWQSSNTSVASLSNTSNSGATVTGAGQGTAAVTATADGVKGSSAITVNAPVAAGCSNPQPGWLWCDDFENDHTSSYFEYTNPGGNSFTRLAGAGLNGSTSMHARWTKGQVDAGSLKLAFGRNPIAYMRPIDAGTADYRELYWRVYVRSQPGWQPNGNEKFSRAIVFAGTNWQEAAILHAWGGSGSDTQNYYVLDPVSGVQNGQVVTTQYNDFAHFTWLGAQTGKTPVFGSGAGEWYCVEVHMKLNDPGQSNGVGELWINGALDAQAKGLNYTGTYTAYSINALFLENYINNGAPQAQVRDYDDLVVSTKRIGCE